MIEKSELTHLKRAKKIFLADAIDLQLQSRQAYWNVKGLNFMDLRNLFDQVAEGVEEYANLIAERLMQLGGRAEGTAQAVAVRSSLNGYAHATAIGGGLVDAHATTLTDFGGHAHYASEQATLLQDVDTAAIFTQIACGIDTWLWFVQTSQQAGS